MEPFSMGWLVTNGVVLAVASAMHLCRMVCNKIRRRRFKCKRCELGFNDLTEAREHVREQHRIIFKSDVSVDKDVIQLR